MQKKKKTQFPAAQINEHFSPHMNSLVRTTVLERQLHMLILNEIFTVRINWWYCFIFSVSQGQAADAT